MNQLPPWFALPQRSQNLTSASATGKTATRTTSSAINSSATNTTADELNGNQSSFVHPYVIVGAGLAGCNMARELAERGKHVLLIDAASAVASGASGNPAGIVKPFVTRQPTRAAQFYTDAFAYLLESLHRRSLFQNCEFNACSVLQLVQSPFSESSVFKNLTQTDASTHATIDVTADALLFNSAGWLNPAKLCTSLLQHPLITRRLQHALTDLDQVDGCWRLTLTHDNRTLHVYANDVILASGHELASNRFTKLLPLVPARGQISRFSLPNCSQPACVISGKHYVIPDGDTVLVGATFARNNSHAGIEQQDHLLNLAGLAAIAPQLQVNTTAIAGYAGVRATTLDRLPLLGPAPDIEQYSEVYSDIRHGKSPRQFGESPLHRGLFVIGGLGSRGIVSAGYAASLLAAYLCEESATLGDYTDLLHPARFCIRELKRA